MMTKVGKSDGEGTFRGPRGTGEVAPFPAIGPISGSSTRSSQRPTADEADRSATNHSYA